MVYLLAIALCVAADQALKLWTVANLALYESAPLVPGIVELKYIRNTGGGFSILTGHTWLLAALTAVAVLKQVLSVRDLATLMESGVMEGSPDEYYARFLNGMDTALKEALEGVYVRFMEKNRTEALKAICQEPKKLKADLALQKELLGRLEEIYVLSEETLRI